MNLIGILGIISFVAIELGCVTGGTHGSIKAYSFPVPKSLLQSTVSEIINGQPDLRIAPITDTLNSRYYNDGERYVTLEIGDSVHFNRYIFQFSGDKEDWDTSKSSEISIAYAYDKNGNGGSAGNGKFTSCSADVRHAIVDLFEKEFIEKIDSVLKRK